MKTLTIVFDVSALSDDEIGHLELEAVVQGERNEDHPHVPLVKTAITSYFENEQA